MSIWNNEDTLIHISGAVWISKPTLTGNEIKPQPANICIRTPEGEFVAVDFLRLEADGQYTKKGKALGKIDDEAFVRYITQTHSVQNDEVDIPGIDLDSTDKVTLTAELYKKTKSIRTTAKRVHLSEKTIRRILIRCGLINNGTIKKVSELYASGKSTEDISKELGLTPRTVVSYTALSNDEAKRLCGRLMQLTVKPDRKSVGRRMHLCAHASIFYACTRDQSLCTCIL